jgi:hypothetical protein
MHASLVLYKLIHLGSGELIPLSCFDNGLRNSGSHHACPTMTRSPEPSRCGKLDLLNVIGQSHELRDGLADVLEYHLHAQCLRDQALQVADKLVAETVYLFLVVNCNGDGGIIRSQCFRLPCAQVSAPLQVLSDLGEHGKAGVCGGKVFHERRELQSLPVYDELAGKVGPLLDGALGALSFPTPHFDSAVCVGGLALVTLPRK